MALFVITLHTGGRVAGLGFFELLAIACAVQFVGFWLLAFYYQYLNLVRISHPEDGYLRRSKAFQLAAGLVVLIGISACAGGGLLIFR